MRKPNQMWILYLLTFTLAPVHTPRPTIFTFSSEVNVSTCRNYVANIIQLLLTVIRGSLSCGAGQLVSPFFRFHKPTKISHP